MPSTVPNLTGVISLGTDEGYLVLMYQGIRMTIIPNGGTVRYSKIDDPNLAPIPANHDAATQADITDETTVDSDWPYYLVTVTSGTARLALV